MQDNVRFSFLYLKRTKKNIVISVECFRLVVRLGVVKTEFKPRRQLLVNHSYPKEIVVQENASEKGLPYLAKIGKDS